MNIMDRDIILKHSKSIWLNRIVLPDFIELISDICNKKGHSEHLQVLINSINIPMIGQEIIRLILEEYEKEYHIIKLINLKNNQIIDIW